MSNPNCCTSTFGMSEKMGVSRVFSKLGLLYKLGIPFVNLDSVKSIILTKTPELLTQISLPPNF